MLKDVLEKIDTNEIKFENDGIILFCPSNKIFYKIAFGDGTNADALEEGCDDYMYLVQDKYDENGWFQEDIDGGQLDFNRKDYTGYINDEKLIRDCLSFMDCPDIDNCIFIAKFS